MSVVAALAIVFMMLMFCVYKGIYLLYPLIIGLLIFMYLAVRRGFKLNQLLDMILKSTRKSFMIISILILIGAITAVWRASGTIPFLVYFGIKLMNPSYFILCAFLMSSAVSLLLGSAFGTIGTIGSILMVMVKGGDINTSMVAGAIISGAYFGDRISPVSSSANLVAAVTNTELYTNVKNMFKTTVVPYVLTMVLYAVLSVRNPLHLGESHLSEEIMSAFNLSWIVVIPALIILVLAAFRVEVKLSMVVSIICGIVIAVFVQQADISDILRFILFGYKMEGQTLLGNIIEGGGIISMLSASMIIMVAFALSGIFEGTSLLEEVELWMKKMSDKVGLFTAMIITSLITGSFGCSQTLALMMAYQLMKRAYDSAGVDKHELAIDIENTAIVISAIIPWNIAGAVPAAALSVDAAYILYSFYLYVLPLTNLLAKRFRFLNLYVSY